MKTLTAPSLSGSRLLKSVFSLLASLLLLVLVGYISPLSYAGVMLVFLLSSREMSRYIFLSSHSYEWFGLYIGVWLSLPFTLLCYSL